MKLKVINVENGDYNLAIKKAVIVTAISYAKIYELLHKQIWRKAPSRIGLYENPSYTSHNGRPVKFVRHWDIKSHAVVPYSRDGGDHTFGLNQLFMEQDYRKPYVGNPKDGIYHDDCYIQPKVVYLESGSIEAWAYWTQENILEPKLYGTIYRKQDTDGTVLISNVVYSTYENGGKTYRRITVTYADDSTIVTELGELLVGSGTAGIDFATVQHFSGTVEQWIVGEDFESIHGDVIHNQVMPNNNLWVTSTGTIAPAEDGWIRVYEDGTVIEYTATTVESWGDGMDNTVPAHYKYLPMMYTDTGDLVMDRVEFVEKWNDYFELIVHEDSEWWQSFIKPIAAIITIVIAAYTGILFSPIGAIGTALSVVGTLTGNKMLSLVGGAMMFAAGATKMLEESLAQETLANAAPSMTIGAARDIASTASFETLFSNFVSNAGFENLAKIGSGVMGVYNDIQALGMNEITQSVESVVEDSGMRVTMSNPEDDMYDPMSVIKL